mmetsp:Transcript_64989/g.148843  ORF Transcript_64989/g.148843 Transcript_64989/m.148843 type:complete len:82 (-) Transcript_64989:262-507(-)
MWGDYTADLPDIKMFALIRQTQLLLSVQLASGPNDLPAGDGPYGAAVGEGDMWGDYTATGAAGGPGSYCAPEDGACVGSPH